MLYGNTEGIKKSILWQLTKLEGQYSKDLYIEPSLLIQLCELTKLCNREICVNIDCRGRLLSVGLGSVDAVEIAKHTTKRSTSRNNGIRCIHTHPSGTAKLSDMDMSALKQTRLDSIAAIGVKNGKFNGIEIAMYSKGTNQRFFYSDHEKIDNDKLLKLVKTKTDETHKVIAATPRAILAYCGLDDDITVSNSLKELKSLSWTMGIETVGTLTQKLKPTKALLFGQGKVGELARLIQLQHATMVIFDTELKPIQQRNLSQLLPSVILLDRSMLILDIFSKHAVSEEGKLQIKLARLRYNLPFLSESHEDMDKQRGGLYALSGSGETKLEKDRRAIKKEIKDLSDKLEELSRKKDSRRQARRDSGLKTVSIVGYTNAGKSTLMNYIAKSDVLVEDKLFATLDVTTRKVWSEKGKYLLSDTVGFISRLPHEFIQAFRSTLEETKYADLLLVVLDVSSPLMNEEYQVVRSVLADIGADNIPHIIVYNKQDKVDTFVPIDTDARSVTISALSGKGVDGLRRLIENHIFPTD